MKIFQIPGFSEPFSSMSHLLGAFFFLFGTYFLLAKGKGNKKRQLALSIYSFCLVFLFSMSGVYHLLEPNLTPRYVLKHLDYAGIWILIAGTFIPLHYILFRGKMRWAVLAPVWILATTGLSLQMVFFDVIPHWLILSFFLVLGWIGAISTWMINKAHSDIRPLLIVLGGIFYSIGAVFDFLNWPLLIYGIVGPHEVFHLFVLLGAFTHWLFIYQISHNPISNELIINVKESLKENNFVAIGRNEALRIESNSAEELHQLVQAWAKDNYPSNMLPREIIIKHSKVYYKNDIRR